MNKKNCICENYKCKKNMSKNFLYCAKCFKRFCCNSCINSHLNEFHGRITSKDQPLIDTHGKEKNEESVKTKENSENKPESSSRINTLNSESANESKIEIIEAEPEKPLSLFIKEGNYLSEYLHNPHYDFSNFELRRDQPLGRGAFGAVITAINKKDGKKYAIKQVFFSNNFTFT